MLASLRAVLAAAACAALIVPAAAAAHIEASPAPVPIKPSLVSSTCEFSSDRTASSPFDNQVATLLSQQLTQYRLTTRYLPHPPKIYDVGVIAHTAILDVDREDPNIEGRRSLVPQANDFRYAQIWQRVYDAAYHTSGACVRMMLIIHGGNAVLQRCWGSEGATCQR